MIDAPHFGFVVAAYGIAAFATLAMVGAIWLDYRRQCEALRRLEARGTGAKP